MRRVELALRSSSLKLFDVVGNPSPISQFAEVSQVFSRFFESQQILLTTLLSGANPQLKKTFTAIDASGVLELSQLSQRLGEGPSALGRVKIRTVFGAADGEMPARSLQYFLPALQFLEGLRKSFPKATELPTVEFVFMNQAGALANNLDVEKVKAESRFLIEVAKKFFHHFHPELEQYIHYLSDDQFTIPLLHRPEFEEVEKAFAETLAESPHLLSRLEQMGDHHGGNASSVRYAVLHSYLHDGFLTGLDSELAAIAGQELQLPELLISIGARPEQDFYELRKLSHTAIQRHDSGFQFVPTVQYLTNINVPPYLALAKEDLLLRELLEDPSLLIDAMPQQKTNNAQKLSPYQIPVQHAMEAITENVRGQEKLIAFLKMIGE